MAIPRLILIFAALVSCIFTVEGQTAGSFGFRKVASWPGFVRGTPTDLDVVGNFAYVAMGEGGLCIVNVTSRTAPVIVSRLDLPGNATRIKVRGDYAFLACGASGLQIVDLANPSAPSLVSSFDTAGTVLGVGLAYPYAFLADGVNGIVVADLTNPANPVLTTQIPFPGTVYDLEAEAVTSTDINTQVTTTNRYLQVVNGTNGFLAYEVTDPLSYHLVKHDAAGDARVIARDGRNVFWVDHSFNNQFITLFDFTRPFGSEQIGIVDNFPATQTITRLVVGPITLQINPALHVFSGSASYDIAPYPFPTVVALRRPAAEVSAAEPGDGYVYYLDNAKGLTIYKSGALVSATAIGAEASRIKVAGNRIYVTDTQAGLEILNVGADGTLTFQSRYSDGFLPGAFDVVGSNIFVWTGSTNLEALDVSNATQPMFVTNVATILTNRPTDIIGNDIAIRDGFAYVSGLNLGLVVLNVSNPAIPTFVRRSGINGLGLYSMNITGTNLFASEVRGLASIGINADKSASILDSIATTITTGFTQRRMRLAGNIAYFCDRDNGLKIYDVSDPTNMILLSTYDTPGSVFSVAVSGSFAYVSDQRDGILVLDVSNPSNPTLVATLPLSNSPFDLEVRNNRLFVAQGAEGVSIWDLVPKQAQTINFPPISDKTTRDLPFTISATASSGLPVAFAMVSGPATIENGQVTITGSGVVTIRATQGGNDEFGAVFADRTFAVTKATQTINFPPIADKTTRSAPFEISAPSDSGLPVQIYVLSGPAEIDGGIATNTAMVTTTGGGAVTIRATQFGNNVWTEATVDRSFNVVVVQRDTQTLSAPQIAAMSVDDEPLNLQISASSGLPVEVTVSGSAIFDGTMLTPIGLGAVTITANQSGDRDFEPATLTRTFTVYDLPGAATANVVARNPSLPAAATLPDADPDNDGLPNIVEYILRTDPTSATSMEGHMTGTLYESGGARYLKTHFLKPRTLRYPVGVQVADFADYPNLTWISIPAGFNDEGSGDFLWPLNGNYQSPLIRFVVRYP